MNYFHKLGRDYLKHGRNGEAISALYQAVTLSSNDSLAWADFARSFRFVQFTKEDAKLEAALIACFQRDDVPHQDMVNAAMSLVRLSKKPFFASKLFLAMLPKVILPFEDVENEIVRYANAHGITPEVAEHGELSEYIEDIPQLNPKPYYITSEEVASLKPISDTVSQKVQQQYEENPYPRWRTLATVEPIHVHSYLKELFPDQDFQGLNKPLRMLIAGCGTGQQALQAWKKYKNVTITAVDLSKASLAYAQQKAHEYGASMRFLQADLLDLEQLGEQFDIIECHGVLHHMEYPEKGLQVLRNILAPGGLMNLGLYSTLARQDVKLAREYIEKKGFEPTLEGIRACRKALLALPEDHPIKPVTKSFDFYTTSSCRDLLFHVQEHTFTLPQLQHLLQTNDLSFLGFELTDPQTLPQYLALYPDDPYARTLTNWHAFEQQHPHTFLTMYQFWVKSSIHR